MARSSETGEDIRMGTTIEELLSLMAALRNPAGGCPWDLEQTFATIAPYTIEEAYEVADAIERGDLDGLRDELGDLLLQVVFHARMAEEIGAFAFPDVVGAIADKLIRRHPHVFAHDHVADAEAQTAAWENHKAAERRAKGGDGVGILDDVPRTLPALARALKLQKRAATIGFDWPDPEGALAKLTEETAEVKAELADGGNPERLAEELGDLLFSCVNLARKLKLDPEQALSKANGKFERRFRRIEALNRDRGGRDIAAMTLDELEALWVEAKREQG
jgi:MazG family protein